MILKIDLEKAFDKIKWCFIKDILQFFGFPHNLTKLIMFCVTITSIVALVNGRKTPFLNHLKWLGREIPCPPTYSSCAWRDSLRELRLKFMPKLDPISILNSRPKISHLFFADDLTLLTKANASNCHTIIKILRTFSYTSGQTINHTKSKVVFSKNCTNDNSTMCSQILNI